MNVLKRGMMHVRRATVKLCQYFASVRLEGHFALFVNVSFESTPFTFERA